MERNRQGLSLLELIFAATILGIATLYLLQLYVGGVRITQATFDEVAATSYASDVLEQLQSAEADLLPETGSASSADGTLRNGASIPGGLAGPFYLEELPSGLEATLTITTPSTGLRRAVVQVTRPGGKGPKLTVTLETLMEQVRR
ncbi:MAG: type II secretion system protein [Candidatus Riflebacteria bacterium]|nr:type II secretion system protein [Candidatus Riflebacteria bacterium]